MNFDFLHIWADAGGWAPQSKPKPKLSATFAQLERLGRLEQAVNSVYFGRHAAKCGLSSLLQMFLDRRDIIIPHPLSSCIAGACASGDVKCLEICLHAWKTGKTGNVRQMELTTPMGMLGFLFERGELDNVSEATLEWISSKLSKDDILKYITSFAESYPFAWFIELYDLSFFYESEDSVSSVLLIYCSVKGSLNLCKWLLKMGVRSKSALAVSVIHGRAEIIEFLLATDD